MTVVPPQRWILILGAASDIARALAEEYAKHGYSLMLASRNMAVLETDRQHWMTQYRIDCQVLYCDALDFSSHQAFYDQLNPKPFGVVCAVGLLGEPTLSPSTEALNSLIQTNLTGCISLLNPAVFDFQRVPRPGFIIGISSVAGDRGRQYNTIYASAKAGFNTYLSGIRNLLCPLGVHVMTIKPGFTDTKMTDHLVLPPLLTTSAKRVAQDIIQAQHQGMDVLYTGGIWYWLMLVIRCLPEGIYKRLKLNPPQLKQNSNKG